MYRASLHEFVRLETIVGPARRDRWRWIHYVSHRPRGAAALDPDRRDGGHRFLRVLHQQDLYVRCHPALALRVVVGVLGTRRGLRARLRGAGGRGRSVWVEVAEKTALCAVEHGEQRPGG